ncbi:unnamed protein product [Rotaria sp. Silwood1]|nr:unnamed protein product [Rotaria sp. Silwood1]CAF1644158.1 unnamed protein product [Rotaria sp. Silwood1]
MKIYLKINQVNKTVIQEQFLINILDRKQLSNIQFELALNQNMHRCQVIQTNILSDQIKNAKIVKEKVQRKVDHALLKIDENIQSFSKPTQILSRLTYNSLVKQYKSLIESNQELLIIDKNINNELLPNLRSLLEQGCGCGCSLDLIRHITYNISLLIKENGSIAEKPLMKHFQQQQILFHVDFQLLLIRYDMIALEDLMVLLIVSKLAKPNEIKSYAKTIFRLNLLIMKKQLCTTATDLFQLLYHVLKLDRLKRIIDMMTIIKNYIHSHPINTFNALKPLKLEFDFNNYDMKFLHDLKLLSDIWYKRYLLSQTNETDRIVSEIIDEEQEQEDQNQHKFHSAIDEDFDLDAYNELFKTKELQSNISEQHKQDYLEIDKLYIDDQSMKTSEEIQQIIEESSSEKRLSQIRTLSQTSKKDQIRIIGDSKYFNQIPQHEYFAIQPIFRTHLEVAIRTLDIDLQLIGQIFNGKTLTDIIPNKPSIIIKTSLQSMTPIELQIDKDITLIRNNLSTIAMNMKNFDYSGNLIEQPLCLVDEHNMPISDELNLIRLPFESDHFHISNDKQIVDKNEISLSEPITFKQLTLESIKFEYVDDDRKTIQVIEISSSFNI